ncbi:MAG: hypothetical protein SP1CHLAM54_06420 [Chlamydiia bacterium]|nr:hypothetical protein [Chlamydiia bacterium]MCH9615552.1 hypothetical protein [Chlamydiia bacterium]MCH9629207.1 hypothetical protein [Chlamydiia bacterium]
MAVQNHVNSLFHPFHVQNTCVQSTWLVVANLALTFFTCGAYALVFIGVHVYEALTMDSSVPALPGPSPAGGVVERVKTKLADHLVRLETLAARGEWRHLRRHTTHPDSGFDWWMFPINRSSAGQGTLYQVSPADIAELKRDPVFMERYRRGVKLVALSWGWDLENRRLVTGNPEQRWDGYEVRLGKMLDSIGQFGEIELKSRLIGLIRSSGTVIHRSWVRNYMSV